MQNPPNTIKLVMEAVCVLCKIPPLPIPNPKFPKERIMDYWEAAKFFLKDKDFLLKLRRLIQYKMILKVFRSNIYKNVDLFVRHVL